MKRYYAAALLALTILLSGCYKQDYSLCDVENNLVLKFELNDGNGASLFAEKINSIDAVVFDADNRFVAHKRVLKNELNEFPGITLTVEPGDYRVVCWGNVGENSRLVGTNEGKSFGESYLETVSNASGCPLYYSPNIAVSDRPDPIVTRASVDGVDYDNYKVTVPPNVVTTHQMIFTRAHRQVTVFLKNYQAIHETALPVIKFNNIPQRYDFFLRTCPSRKTYESTCTQVNTSDGDMLAVTFRAPITAFADNMLIEVLKSSTQEVVTTINLKKYVEDNDAKINDKDEFEVQATYHGVYVEISTPSWSGKPIVPEW